MITRRGWIAGALGVPAWALPQPKGVLIETHVHLFGDDPARFPFSKASYQPKPNPVEPFVKFAQEAKLDHAVIVHPEPYQDDHRYLEYCLSKEPSKGFFKATCLFDPIDPETPKRMQTLMKRNPGRIVALRIHETHNPGTPSTTNGAIRDRDLHDPQMAKTWAAAHELGLGIQLHFIPHYAPQIAELVAKFRDMPIILDHLARGGHGTPEEFDEVLKLSKYPRVYMKYSDTGVAACSRQPYPHLDAKPIVRRAYEAFGAERMIWGELGNSMATFEKTAALLDTMFDYAPDSDRVKIRGLTAKKLFAFA
ncbi:MAG TPA: amidohydrolase family protein [Bryobacteraceae bacterium]|jgi:predicted TIM-barrel fold metal-dependent hydrolase